MNRSDIIAFTAQKASITKCEAKKILDAFLESIETGLASGDKISLKGFGTFETRKRAARKVRNPHSSEIITIPPTTVPFFKPGKAIREMVEENNEHGINSEGDEQPAISRPAAEPENPEQPTERSSDPGNSPANYGKTRSKPKVIAVTSGKGGTGKTNFVINSAIALAQKGLKVFVIDADLGTANVDILLGLQCKHTINSLIDNPDLTLLDITVEGPEGIKIVPGGSGLQTLAELPSEELARIIGMLKPLEELADVILIDTGSGISRNVVDFALASDEVVVVITPEPHSISDAYAIIKVLNGKEMKPPVKLVFNLVESNLEARQVSMRLHDVTERFLNLVPETIGHIVKDENLVRSVKQFKPIVLYNPLAPSSRCFISIADKLVPTEQEVKAAVNGGKSFLGKLRSLFSRAAV
jgi:flagellar biosynthesis protein FlhG